MTWAFPKEHFIARLNNMTFHKTALFLFSFWLCSCSASFNFSGSSVPDEANAIYVSQFYNQSLGGPATLSQNFTEQLREYFQRNTKLAVETRPVANELSLEGSITKYEVRTAAAQSNNGQESASQNKLTMAVKVSFQNPFNPEEDFQETISFQDTDPMRNKNMSHVIYLDFIQLG